MKRIGIFVIMRGILIFGVRNVHFKPWNILLIKKEKDRRRQGRERRSRGLKRVHVIGIKAFIYFISVYVIFNWIYTFGSLE